MNSRLAAVTAAIAHDVLSLVRLVMDEQGLSQSALREQTQVVVAQTDNPVMHIVFNDYVPYLEAGRLPRSGKMIPVSELLEWAKSKGLPTDNGTLFAISKTIWERGQAPRPILASLDSRLDIAFGASGWADKWFEAVLEELTPLF